jgi:hypothetical protein
MSEARASFPPHQGVRRLCVPYKAGLYGSTEQAVPANDRPCRFAVKSGTTISEPAAAMMPRLDGRRTWLRSQLRTGARGFLRG